MAINVRRRRIVLWSVAAVTVAAAIAIPVGIVYGVRSDPGEERVNKVDDASSLVAITYGTDLNDAGKLTVSDPAYPSSQYQDPVLVSFTGYAAGTQAGTPGLTVVLKYAPLDTSVSTKIVTYTLTVAKASVPNTSGVSLNYTGYVYGTDLITASAVDYATFAGAAELRTGYVLVTDPAAATDAPYFSKSATGSATDVIPATDIADVNAYAKSLGVNNGVAQLSLVYTANLDETNYESSVAQIKTVVRIIVKPGTATSHQDETKAVTDGFTYGDTALPANEAPATYPDYERADVFTRISGTTRAAIQPSAFPTISAGDQIEAVYTYTPNTNYTGGQAFKVTKTFTVQKAAAVKSTLGPQFRDLTYGEATSTDVPATGPGVGYQPWQPLVFEVTDQTDANAVSPWRKGDKPTAANINSNMVPAGTTYTGTARATVDANHTGDDHVYTFTAVVKKATLSGQRNVQPIDVDAVDGTRVASTRLFTPVESSAIKSVRANFELDPTVATYFVITSAPDPANRKPGEPDNGKRYELANVDYLSNLSAGYRFDQVFVGRLTAAAAANYQLAAGTTETYTIQWIVDPEPVVKNFSLYEDDSAFATNFVKLSDLKRPVPTVNHLAWELSSIIRDDAGTETEIPLTNNAAELQAAATDALPAGSSRTVTARFISRPKVGRAIVYSYEVVYTFKVDASTWDLRFNPAAGSTAATALANIVQGSGTEDFNGDAVPSHTYLESEIVEATKGGQKLGAQSAAEYLNGLGTLTENLFVRVKIDFATVKTLQFTGDGLIRTTSAGTVAAASINLLNYESGKPTDFAADPGTVVQNGTTDWELKQTVTSKSSAYDYSVLT